LPEIRTYEHVPCFELESYNYEVVLNVVAKGCRSDNVGLTFGVGNAVYPIRLWTFPTLVYLPFSLPCVFGWIYNKGEIRRSTSPTVFDFAVPPPLLFFKFVECGRICAPFLPFFCIFRKRTLPPFTDGPPKSPDFYSIVLSSLPTFPSQEGESAPVTRGLRPHRRRVSFRAEGVKVDILYDSYTNW